MTVEEIIKAVRLCYDEEEANISNLSDASSNDNTLMDNIIKNKIGDAVRWICLYCAPELLGGSDEVTASGGSTPVPTGILVDKTPSISEITGQTGGTITLEPDFIKLARVRVSGWHRAVKVPLEEDSDEYLQLYDTNGAAATADRPQAAIIDKSTKQLEVWPTGSSAEYTYVAAVDPEANAFWYSGESVPLKKRYPLPPRVKTAFIYYLAFLVLSAYEDSRAQRMLEIAKMNTGRSE